MSEVIPDDVLHWAATYHGPAFHALLSDPPYHLVTPRFEKTGGADRKEGPGPYGRTGRGFMGKEWDGGDVAFQPETWAAIAAHLLPGAFGMVFASSRGWHRLACAIEDAGMVIHPTLFLYAFGSGFPKATNISMQLEKTLCEQRLDEDGNKKWYYLDDGEPIRTKPPFRHPEADKWYGHRYGLQALKPAVEPIIVFQVPYRSKPVECITATGAGALNIDDSRVEGEPWAFAHNEKTSRSAGIMGHVSGARSGIDESHPAGRWPANLLLDEAAAARLDEQSGTARFDTSMAVCYDSSTYCEWECATCGSVNVGDISSFVGGNRAAETLRQSPNMFGYGSKPTVLCRMDTSSTIGTETSEITGLKILSLSAGESIPTGTPITSVKWMENGSAIALCATCGNPLTLSPSAVNQAVNAIASHAQESGGHNGQVRIATTSMGGCATGDTNGPSRFFYVVREQLDAADPVRYVAKASRRERDAGLEEMERQITDDGRQKPIDNPYLRGKTLRHNPHPTVKPIALMRYLATLLLPPAEYAPRRICIPFAGVASEMIGAALAGWEDVVGIEREAEYVEIGRARLAHWIREQQCSPL